MAEDDGAVDDEPDADAESTRSRVEITDTYYLVLAAMLFTIGAVGVLVRRNVLVMFMCVELMLNAVNLTFVSFARELNDIRGQVIVFFMLVGRRRRGRGRPRRSSWRSSVAGGARPPTTSTS